MIITDNFDNSLQCEQRYCITRTGDNEQRTDGQIRDESADNPKSLHCPSADDIVMELTRTRI